MATESKVAPGGTLLNEQCDVSKPVNQENTPSNTDDHTYWEIGDILTSNQADDPTPNQPDDSNDNPARIHPDFRRPVSKTKLCLGSTLGILLVLSTLIGVTIHLVNQQNKESIEQMSTVVSQTKVTLTAPTIGTTLTATTIGTTTTYPDYSETGTEKQSGVYKLLPNCSAGFDAYCDQGWTIIMKRFDGSQDFYLDWDDYKHGFGNKSGEHWLGNDNLHYLTNQGDCTVRLEFTVGSRIYFSEHSHFKVANEAKKYQLSVENYKTNSYPALTYHNSMHFSTKDRDYDYKSRSWGVSGHCAQIHKGGFWYKSCYRTNPTGPYDHTKGCIYYSYDYPSRCATAITMKMKC